MQLLPQPSPKHRELHSKRSALIALESTLASRELELATLHTSLTSFEKNLTLVGQRYAQLDDLLAQIAPTFSRGPRGRASHANTPRLPTPLPV